ncbi:unnamed protein product [Pylaiella littoralis]
MCFDWKEANKSGVDSVLLDEIVASFSQKEHTGVALARTSADVFVEESLRISLKNDGATETTASSVHVCLVSTTALGTTRACVEVLTGTCSLESLITALRTVPRRRAFGAPR